MLIEQRHRLAALVGKLINALFFSCLDNSIFLIFFLNFRSVASVLMACDLFGNQERFSPNETHNMSPVSK